MIKIGICDDDSIFTEKLYDIINHVMFSVDEWEPCIFRSKEEIIMTIEQGMFDCQLLFMDIMMQNGVGMQVAQYLYTRDIHVDTIFVTASREHVFECYHYGAFAYLLKPVSETDVTQELNRYFGDLRYSHKYLPISFNGITHQIPISSICYIESNRRKLKIYTRQGAYVCYQKLNDIAQKLEPYDFVRCHQSYLVAVRMVSKYTANYLYVNGIAVPVSARYRQAVREMFDSLPPEGKEFAYRRNFQQMYKAFGAIVCVQGDYLGTIIRIKPEQEIVIGRDGEVADFVVNLPFVSRYHCTLVFHPKTMEYEVTDYSSNGTFVNGGKRLLPDEPYILKAGSELSFGSTDTVFKLG